MIPNLKIDGERLWDSLMDTARFGATPKGGLKRLTLSADDKLVRDWFVAEATKYGCTVGFDEVGNLFARRPGKDPSLPPIAMGSHLDTQPTGGKFDGILGVLGALEVMRTLATAGYETNAPIEVVDWANEEGSRFSPAMLASGVFAGIFSRETAWETKDRDGIAYRDALEGIGYLGEERAGDHPLSAYFELHIEQGPILEAEGETIGVLTGVQGMRWYDVTVTGQDAHTGATPMRLRKDALVGASLVIAGIERIAETYGSDAVASVGTVEVHPNSRNVVPGEVAFTVDLRHPDDAVIDRMEADFRALLADTCVARGLDWTESRFWNSPAVRFDPRLVDCVDRAAAKHGFLRRRMVSGAGHDAVYLSRVTPTTMIFVPCAGGVSHNESEDAQPVDCAAGAQVLLDAVLAFDATLARG
ncbi:MAG: M20 family metallo-hydrolase [Phyllobacteriaceae bacterium]|nr:M20 family metallo-hydrolase [Phyllobacteriaceae bacterium]